MTYGMPDNGRPAYGAPGYSAHGYGPTAGYGAGVTRHRGASPEPAVATGDVPKVVWVNLTQDSQLLRDGLPNTAPALSYDKAQTIFSAGHQILQEIVENISAEVTITHDPDWTLFPEVAEAIKAAGGEENCFGVAVHAAQGKWSVGIGSGWKGREASAKLSLALALAADLDSERLDALVNSQPEFAALLQQANLVPATQGGGAKRSREAEPFAEEVAELLDATQDVFDPDAAPETEEAAAPPPALPSGERFGQQGPICWVQLKEDSKILQDGFPPEAPAVSHDKQNGEAFRAGHYVLSELVENLADNVIFNHDTDWDVLPEVGRALKQAGAEENCYCVATCPSLGKWAIGLAGGWKNREAAAKLALSVALLVDTEAFDDVAGRHPEFAAFCAQAGIGSAPVRFSRSSASPPAGPPAAKRRKAEASGSGWLPPPLVPRGDGIFPGFKGGFPPAGPLFGAVPPPFAGKGRPGKAPLPLPLPKGQVKGGKAAFGNPFKGGKGGGGKGAGKPPPANAAPRDTPLWVSLALEEECEALQEYPRETIVVATNGNTRKELYSPIDKILTHLIGEDEVVYKDDPNWANFPQVGNALKCHGDAEPINVALCPSRSAWGVGIGGSPHSRLAAAKVALATVLTLKAAETAEVPDLTDFPEFAEFVGEVQPPL